jgi:TonB family protein
MFNIDASDFQRFAVSSIGAVAVSAACLFGAVGPAKAASPSAPVSATAWQKQVERKINSSSDDLSMLDGSSKVHKVLLAANFTADGDFAGVQLAQSSGNRRLDNRAKQIVSHISYPALPTAYRGQAQKVTMRLFFGTNDAAVAEAAHREPVQFAWESNAGAAGAPVAVR